MSDTPEALSAILAEMRLDADILVFPTLTPDKLRTYADRIEAAEMREREQKRKLHSESIARLEDKLAESVRKNELLRAENIQLANDVEKANRKIERLSGNIASELKSALIEILDRTNRENAHGICSEYPDHPVKVQAGAFAWLFAPAKEVN